MRLRQKRAVLTHMATKGLKKVKGEKGQKEKKYNKNEKLYII